MLTHIPETQNDNTPERLPARAGRFEVLAYTENMTV